MRRVLTTVLAVALLLGLGALAVLALPSANASLASAPPVSAAAPEFEPDAPAAPNNVNVIAMPLNAANQFTSAGKAFTADGLAGIVGAGVQQVLTWNAPTQTYRTWFPVDQEGDNFSLAVGGAYRLLLDSTANTIVSFVGDVPAQGSVSFTLTRPTSGACLVNDISIPLDQSALTNANALATSIGSVEQVLEWNPTTQTYRTWFPIDQEGDNFQIKIGYPYRVCLGASADTVWP